MTEVQVVSLDCSTQCKIPSEVLLPSTTTTIQTPRIWKINELHTYLLNISMREKLFLHRVQGHRNQKLLLCACGYKPQYVVIRETVNSKIQYRYRSNPCEIRQILPFSQDRSSSKTPFALMRARYRDLPLLNELSADLHAMKVQTHPLRDSTFTACPEHCVPPRSCSNK